MVINGVWLMVGPLIQTLPTSELRTHSTAQCTLLQTTLNDGIQCWTWISSIHWQPPLHHQRCLMTRWFSLLSAMANTHRCTIYCNSYYNRPGHRLLPLLSFRHGASVFEVRPHSPSYYFVPRAKITPLFWVRAGINPFTNLTLSPEPAGVGCPGRNREKG